MALRKPDNEQALTEVATVEARLEICCKALAARLDRRAGPEARLQVSAALARIGDEVARLDLALRHLSAALHGSQGMVRQHGGLACRRSADERLRLWPRLRRLVEQVGGKRRRPRQPLFQSLAHDDPLAVREGLAESLYEGLHRGLRPPDPRGHAALGYHPDIPLPLSVLLALLQAARRIALAQGRSDQLCFLDVGSGLGSVLMAALPLFHSVTGLELDPASLNAARDLLAGESAAHLLQGDALEFDGYQRFDVIFYFQPIRDEALMRRLEDRIATQARPGTLILAPGALSAAESRKMQTVDGAILVTGKSAAEARRLRLAAEWIGTALPPLAPAADADRLGWLFPLVSRCRALGFDLDQPQARWPARRS